MWPESCTAGSWSGAQGYTGFCDSCTPEKHCRSSCGTNSACIITHAYDNDTSHQTFLMGLLLGCTVPTSGPQQGRIIHKGPAPCFYNSSCSSSTSGGRDINLIASLPFFVRTSFFYARASLAQSVFYQFRSWGQPSVVVWSKRRIRWNLV